MPILEKSAFWFSLVSIGFVLVAFLFAGPDIGETWHFDNLAKIGGHRVQVLGHPRVIDTPLGKAVEFNGVDDALFFDVHPLAGAETFTWEVIFRPDADGPPEQRFFHLQESDPKTGLDTETRMLFEVRLIDGKWCLDNFALSGSESKTLIDRQKLHPVGPWYHAALQYDGHELRNYVDGVLEGSAELHLSPQGPGHSSVGVRINKRDYFKGAVLLTRMTRRALSPSEFLSVGRSSADPNILRNDRVTATKIALDQGESVSIDGKHPAVNVFSTAGSLEFAITGGSAVQNRVSRGDAVFVPAQAGVLKNAGHAMVSFVRIELLSSGSADIWGDTGLSPHYKLLIENQYVRVYDIKIPSDTKEPQHTHKDRVVVCLSGATLKHVMPDGREESSTLHTGEVAWRKGGTHVGQNLGTTDLWAIAVEPK